MPTEIFGNFFGLGFAIFGLLIYGYSMTATLDLLSHDALGLPPDQRVALAYRLLVSVEPDPEPGVDEAWDAEIVDRIACFDAGQSQTVSASDVFAKLSEIAPAQ